MKTDELIVELARAAGPVRRLPPPMTRAWQWTVVAAAVGVGAAFLIGWRSDLADALTRASFLGLAAAAAASALLAAVAAFTLSVPGAERSRLGRWLPFAAVGVWLLLNVAALFPAASLPSAMDDAVHGGCVTRVKAIAALPALVILLMVRRAAPLEPLWTSVLAASAAGSFALATIQFICPIDAPAHALVSHFAPTLIFVLLAGALGRQAMMSWNRAAPR